MCCIVDSVKYVGIYLFLVLPRTYDYSLSTTTQNYAYDDNSRNLSCVNALFFTIINVFNHVLTLTWVW